MKAKQRTLNTNSRTFQEGNLSVCTDVISGECGGHETCGDRWLTSAQHALYLLPLHYSTSITLIATFPRQLNIIMINSDTV